MHPLWLSRKTILVDWGDFTTLEHITCLPKLAVSQLNPNTASQIFFGTFPNLFRTILQAAVRIPCLPNSYLGINTRKPYSPSIPVDTHPATPNQKAGAYNIQMVHSWTFRSVWSSGINQESDILKCDFNFSPRWHTWSCQRASETFLEGIQYLLSVRGYPSGEIDCVWWLTVSNTSILLWILQLELWSSNGHKLPLSWGLRLWTFSSWTCCVPMW